MNYLILAGRPCLPFNMKRPSGKSLACKFCRYKIAKKKKKCIKRRHCSVELLDSGWKTFLPFNMKRPSGKSLACVSVFVKHSTVTDNLYICYLFDKSPEGHTSGNFRKALNKLHGTMQCQEDFLAILQMLGLI